MDVVYERCCGLDVHKKTVAACVVLTGEGGEPTREVRTFGTMTDDILQLHDWLTGHGVTHVAMESTGVYWQPVYNLLEDDFTLLLVNAQHVKAVPGRKTDVKDCAWLADLLRHGLLRPSFVPNRQQRELRQLERYRVSLTRERGAEINRLQKTLEGANIKLGDVASEILGVSARQMLERLVAGERDTAQLAQLALGKLRDKIPQLERALSGRFGAHQQLMITQQPAHIDYLDEAIAAVNQEIEERHRPFEEAVQRLVSLPGFGRQTAQLVLAEIGTDMDRFPTAAHLASWAGLCPGNNESAGKRKNGKTRKGSHWLRWALVQAAHAAARAKNTYLGAQYHRLAARRGTSRAAVAVAHTLLVMTYHILKRGVPYQELGPSHYDNLDRARTRHRLVQRLQNLGYHVYLEPAPA